MKKNACFVTLSFLASFCFFFCYMTRTRETLHLILGFAWLCISIRSYSKIVNNKKDEEKENKEKE